MKCSVLLLSHGLLELFLGQLEVLLHGLTEHPSFCVHDYQSLPVAVRCLWSPTSSLCILGLLVNFTAPFTSGVHQLLQELQS